MNSPELPEADRALVKRYRQAINHKLRVLLLVAKDLDQRCAHAQAMAEIADTLARAVGQLDAITKTDLPESA